MSEQCPVSSCLIGLCTRYDGRSKPNAACVHFLENLQYITVCPEQLGGLSTPRVPADLVGGDGGDVLKGSAVVITRNGTEDVSSHFIAGAEAVLNIAQAQDIRLALLKSESPSCGLTRVGVTAALLLRHGIRVIEF